MIGITLCSRQLSDPRRAHKNGTMPCEHRAASIQIEHICKARTHDATYRDDHQVEARLRSFGAILPVVFGAFNNVNPRFSTLESTKLWRSMMARDENAAKGPLLHRMRRAIGMTCEIDNYVDKLSINKHSHSVSNLNRKYDEPRSCTGHLLFVVPLTHYPHLLLTTFLLSSSAPFLRLLPSLATTSH